jgi:hypothetical protein
MDQELKRILETIIGNQVNMGLTLETITNQLDRIESEANSDIVAILESISGKIETLATKEDINYLAGQIGKHDLEIDRLKRVQ